MTKLRSEHDRDIARLAVPALGSLIAEPLYVLADTAIVGRIGTSELAGLAIASTVLLSAHSLTLFLAYGTTGPVARMLAGGREREAADRSLQGLWLGAGLGVIFAVLMVVFARPLLGVIGAEGEVMGYALTYLRVSAIGFPFMLLALAANGSFHGRQNATLPLMLALGGAGLNLIVELILIPGMGYGVGASALSTVIAQVVTGLIATVLVIRWASSRGAARRPSWPIMVAILRTGKALIIRTLCLRGAFTASTAIAARFGVADVAAHQIALQVWGTLALALDAVAIAGQALTGKWLGARNDKKARDATRRMIEIDVALGAVMGLVTVLFRNQIGELFSNDSAVVALTAMVLVHVGVQQPLNGVVFALDGILIGAGDLDYLAKWMVISAATFGVAAAIVAFTSAGLGWLWIAIAVLMAVRAFSLIRRWLDDQWLVVGAD